MRTRWAAIGAAVAVSLGGGVVWVANAATSGTYDVGDHDGFTFASETLNGYQPIEPCRLLDTRSGFVPGKSPSDIGVGGTPEPYQRGIRRGPIGTGTTAANNVVVFFDKAVEAATDITNTEPSSNPDYVYTTSPLGDCEGVIVTGHDPTAVVINLTVTNISQDSFVTLYPYMDPTAKPYVSTITVYRGTTAAMNGATITLGDNPDGSGVYDNTQTFRIYHEANKGSIDVIVDVVGYFYPRTVIDDITTVDIPPPPG